MTSDGLFTAIFVPADMRAAVSGHAWLQAMLDVEAALAAAEARAGVIPADAAATIGACCVADRFDPEQIGVEGRAQANPVIPLVRALTAEVHGDAARYVHWGATSQDVLDTAAMLVARRALSLIEADLDGLAGACARLADEHRSTLMAGRTLLQQALPTTFGLRAAVWLTLALDARSELVRVRDGKLAAQLGGAAGTLASLGTDGLPVLAHFADELGLSEPPVPWHTARTPVAALAGALAAASGALGKIALDVALLSQTEVGEVAGPSGDGRGESSTLPHKRNPVGAALATACARRVHGLAGTLLASMAQEHERAAGAWQAEWEPLSDALALTGGAAASMRETIDGLEVRGDRMRTNLDATRGVLLAERVSMALAPEVGRLEAQQAVGSAAARVGAGGGGLREELVREPLVREHLSTEEIERLLEPSGYLGSADAFVDRALERHGRDMA